MGGGGPPDGGYSDQILYPNLRTSPHKFSLSLSHEVCVRYNDRSPSGSETKCKTVNSPSLADDHMTTKVSQIIGAVQSEYAPEQLSASDVNRTDYATPGALAVGSCILAIMGFKKFRSSQKPQLPQEAALGPLLLDEDCSVMWYGERRDPNSFAVMD